MEDSKLPDHRTVQSQSITGGPTDEVFQIFLLRDVTLQYEISFYFHLFSHDHQFSTARYIYFVKLTDILAKPLKASQCCDNSYFIVSFAEQYLCNFMEERL